MTTKPAGTPPITGVDLRPDGVYGRLWIPRAFIILLGSAAVVILLAGMRAAAWMIAPLFLALIIVIALSPIQRWLLRHGWPRWATTLVLVILVYGLMFSLASVLIVSVGQLATLLPTYTNNAQGLGAALRNAVEKLGIGPEQTQEITGPIDFSNLLGALGGLLSSMSDLLTGLIFLLSLLLFFSVESSGAGMRLAAIGADRPHVADGLRTFAAKTRKYLAVTTIFGLIVAALDTIVLALLGIPLAILWGLLAFITNYIPNIGFVLGVIPPALLGLLVGGWRLAVTVIVVYSVVNFVVQSLIQTRFVGDTVDLSVTVTFLALLFWGWILGPLGTLLAIPLTLLAKALLVDIDPRAGWADALLRSRPGGRPGKA